MAEKFVKISPRIAVQSSVAEKIEIARKKPTKEQFKGKKGYREKADGSWVYNFKPNDGHGKLTREAEEVFDVMRPFQSADVQRHAELSAAAPQASLKSEQGVHYVAPEKADETARRNGWHHHERRRATSRYVAGVGWVRLM